MQVILAGCEADPSSTTWRFAGPGAIPPGLTADFATHAERHLRQVQVSGGIGIMPTGMEGCIEHGEVPTEAVVEALRYALDDLDPVVRSAAADWVLVLEWQDGREVVRLPVRSGT